MSWCGGSGSNPSLSFMTFATQMRGDRAGGRQQLTAMSQFFPGLKERGAQISSIGMQANTSPNMLRVEKMLHQQLSPLSSEFLGCLWDAPQCYKFQSTPFFNASPGSKFSSYNATHKFHPPTGVKLQKPWIKPVGLFVIWWSGYERRKFHQGWLNIFYEKTANQAK